MLLKSKLVSKILKLSKTKKIHNSNFFWCTGKSDITRTPFCNGTTYLDQVGSSVEFLPGEGLDCREDNGNGEISRVTNKTDIRHTENK